MAIDESVTEVADSDEELMTSSPFPGTDGAEDKLCAMTSAQPQEPQGAIQNAHCTSQALGQDDANTATQSTATLDVARCGAPADINASSIGQADVKFEVSHHDLAVHAQINPQRSAPRTVCVPVANSSMGQLVSLAEQTQPSTDAQGLDSSSVPKDACSKILEDTANSWNPQAYEGQTLAGKGDAVSNGSPQTRLEDLHQYKSQKSDIIYPSENAVHRSQAMGKSDTTRVLAAATNSLNPITIGLTRSVSTSVSSKDGIDAHPDADSNEIQDHRLHMNGGDCRSNITFQGPATKTQEVHPFTPQTQVLQEQHKGRGLTLEEVSQPKEAASQGLGTDDTATEPTCESQHQRRVGASPTTMGTSPSKTPQEITLSELKAQRASLLASLRSLPAIQVLMEEMASSNTVADGGCDEPTDVDVMNAANKMVKQHIRLLHEYNELKDVGQGLMGLIADQRGVRIVEVQEEFGVDAED